LILYYQYQQKPINFFFGSFPRRELLRYPLAMLTDTLLYYRPNIEGAFIQLYPSFGYQNAWVDWTSRQTDSIRETFLAGTSGRVSRNAFFLENFLLLYHHAGAAVEIEGQHIHDYLGYALLAGYSLKPKSALTGELKAGLLSSLFRERGVTNGFIESYSAYSELSLTYKHYALKITFHTGDSQRFYLGDPFFKHKNYLRIDPVWHFFQRQHIQGCFNWSLHFADGKMHDSQQLSIIYLLP
jgi:hypothetical protein